MHAIKRSRTANGWTVATGALYDEVAKARKSTVGVVAAIDLGRSLGWAPGFSLTRLRCWRGKFASHRDFDHQGVWLKSGCSNLRPRLATARFHLSPKGSCLLSCLVKVYIHIQSCALPSSREPCSMHPSYMYGCVCCVQDVNAHIQMDSPGMSS